MKNILKQKNKQGMSLLESIVAVGLVMSVVIGSITMSISTIRMGRNSNNRIVALNLAREGIEYVRNLRDSNWLKESEGIENTIPEPDRIYQWDDGMEAGAYNLDQYLESGNWVSDFNLLDSSYEYDLENCGTNCELNVTSNGIYNHTSGVPSNFSRIITLNKDNSEYINVVCKIHWLENEKPKFFTLEENLFDWRYD